MILWELRTRFERVKDGVYCEILYLTDSGRKRTVKGACRGVTDDDKVILEQNKRKNRVPLDRIYYASYNTAEQGGIIE